MFGVSVPQELSRGKYLSENIGQFTENRKQIEEDRLKGPGAFYCSNICHLFSDICLLSSVFCPLNPQISRSLRTLSSNWVNRIAMR